MDEPARHRDTTPPVFLQMAGHPLRWNLLEELARSDRTVRELTERVGQPQNLVSYHLSKLRSAHLVQARRSSADRRDTYYRADLARVRRMLAASGEALHPGLRLIAAPHGDARSRAAKARVLFLCTGNSARSQMAEAFAKARSGGLVKAYSAGSRPKPVHPYAVRAMREMFGIDLTGQRPKHLMKFGDQRFDQVVTLCDRVRQICPEFPEHSETIHWSVPDPSAGKADADDQTSYPAFQQTAAEVETRVGFLLSAVIAQSRPV